MDRRENLCDTFHTRQIPIFRLTSFSPVFYPPGLIQWRQGAICLASGPDGDFQKKDYIEADGTIRLYLTVEEAKTKLRWSRQVAIRAFHELESCGLIFRHSQWTREQNRGAQPGKGERKEAGANRPVFHLCGTNPHPFEDWKGDPRRIGTGVLSVHLLQAAAS